VEEANTNDNSLVQLSPAKMKQLLLFTGDVIFIKGKLRNETLAVVLTDNGL
jgi:hypothetical protein